MRGSRANHRLDGNHKVIVDALRTCGREVLSLSTVGGGAPDLLVRTTGGRLVLLEVKMPGGSLRPAQRDFSLRWPEVKTVETVEGALAATR